MLRPPRVARHEMGYFLALRETVKRPAENPQVQLRVDEKARLADAHQPGRLGPPTRGGVISGPTSRLPTCAVLCHFARTACPLESVTKVLYEASRVLQGVSNLGNAGSCGRGRRCLVLALRLGVDVRVCGGRELSWTLRKYLRSVMGWLWLKFSDWFVCRSATWAFLP